MFGSKSVASGFAPTMPVLAERMCSVYSAVSGRTLAVVDEYEGMECHDFGRGSCRKMGSKKFQMMRCLQPNESKSSCCCWNFAFLNPGNTSKWYLPAGTMIQWYLKSCFSALATPTSLRMASPCCTMLLQMDTSSLRGYCLKQVPSKISRTQEIRRSGGHAVVHGSR